MRKYAIVIERADDGGFGAYAPDLPGCVGMGKSKEETLQNMVEAIQFHLEGMVEEGLPIPEPKSEAENLVFV
ncbi:MAG: type II toxin-antitoxin system HicB family antitoxin [Cyclobacteriaceae bacterium]